MSYVPKIGDKVMVLNDTEADGRYGTGYVGFVTHVDQDNTCKIDNKLGGWVSFHCVKLLKEEQKVKDEISLQNVKFDMKAIAEELGVSLEKAHNIVQAALFERGLRWRSGRDTVQYTDAAWVCVDQTDAGIVATFTEDQMKYPKVSIKPQYSFYVKEEEKPETIEFNGKQYNKEDVAKALALLSPVN